MKGIEVGIRIPNAGPSTRVESILTLASWAEELGYHSIWASDHVILPERVDADYPYGEQGRWPYPAETNWLDPLLALAWAGASAPSVKLGTSVLVVPLRNPVLLAKQLATLDFVSGGRVILGAGAGWMEEEFDLVGVPFRERGARAAEMVVLMRELWSGETVDFEGEFWQLSQAKMRPRPIQPSIPVLWGGHSNAALRRVARLGDGWHPTLIGLDELADGVAKLREYCAGYQRDPATLLVVARPGKVYPINEETLQRQLELGIRHVVIDPPLTGENLADARREMERVAALCELRGRATGPGEVGSARQ